MTNKNSINNSHKKDLLLLFSIPVAIALFSAALIYVPQLLANPKYDFIYSTCDAYRCIDKYSVDSQGFITQEYINPSGSDYYNETTSLHYYDTSENSTAIINNDEARRYKLDKSSKSPDGYILERENYSSGFLFWGSYNDGWYMKNGAKKQEVELAATDSYYARDIKFLGWVIE